MLISTDERLSRARAVLEGRGVAPADLLGPDIAESWQRCLVAGLDPRKPPPLESVDAAALRAARERSGPLMGLVMAEMQVLHQQIAGTNFMVAFANAEGTLIETITDPTFHDTASRTSIRPGVIWSEFVCGTNALGTCAKIGRAISVHGGEHFFSQHEGLTCAATPVFAPDATLLGVLDASSDCRSRQRHTQVLVGMAATQIENGLFREQHRRDLVIAFHSRGEYLHTISAGLLALNADGQVLGANAQARFLLQGLPALPGRRFEETFRTSFGSFADGLRTRDHVRVEDKVGSVFVATLVNRAPIAATRMAVVQPAAKSCFVAEDSRMKAILRQVEQAAARRLPILLRGETGTGKEHMARHAHLTSGRSGAFVPVNCAALPAELIEAELFGHTEGAFTGARRHGSPGLLVEADRGTLLLDEIGDMPLPLQAVLLRLLDDWTVRPLGGGRRREVDVLLVAATNHDLSHAVAEGRFRADLYYRLSTVEVEVPPLRERTDLAQIVAHHLAELAPGMQVGPQALARLAAYHWPGNIRELRTVLTRMALQQEGNDGPVMPILSAGSPPEAPPDDLRATVRARVASVWRETGGNISESARRLGVTRNTIYRSLRGLGCAPSPPSPRSAPRRGNRLGA